MKIMWYAFLEFVSESNQWHSLYMYIQAALPTCKICLVLLNKNPLLSCEDLELMSIAT